MGKNVYNISVIRSGREKDYRDFWDRKIDKNTLGEVLHSDLVGFTDTIEAKNLDAAIEEARRRHPGHQIAKDHCKKLG